MLLTAFFVVPTRWFEMRSGSTYIANIGYADTLQNRRCDILVYGDSTAMIGVDPGILQRRTGLSACNISEYAGISLINHTVLVDDFLAHNPRPRYIVFLYAPNALNQPASWSAGVSTFEGISYLIERQPHLKAALMLASHPVETLTWTETGMRLTLGHIRAKPFPEATRHVRDDYAGRLPIPETTRTSCDMLSDYRVPPDPAWAADLRRRYSEGGTKVLIDATPTSPCDPSLPFFDQHLNAVIDNKPYRTIPIFAYTTDGHLHANKTGIDLISNMIADQIVALSQPTGGN